MKSHRSAPGILAVVLAGAVLTDFASAEPLPNAWQITDNSGVGGSTLNYSTNLTPEQQIAAINLGSGWRYTVHARFVDDFSDAESIAMVYGLGDKRFLVWFDLDSNGDLTARLDGGPTYTLTANGTGHALYHTHEIVFDPTNRTASYLVDGQLKTNNWSGSVSAFMAGQVSWGASSSGGQGAMNFHSATFEINGLGMVAAYDAGTAGSPSVAPDPATQGWTQNPATPATGTIALPVAADTIGALPNAWQIMDDSNAGGSTLNYTTDLTPAQRTAATNLTGGFNYSVHARFLDDFSGSTESMAMIYSLGGKRFLVWWGLDGNSNLTARLEGGLTYTLTANGSGSALYHTHQIILNPTNGTASYVVDGQVKTNNWPGGAGSFTAGQVYWGAGSSTGQGQMNFHTATFEVVGLGVVAGYDAGMVGEPATAPNPVAQGWTLNYSALVGTNAISPDLSLLPEATTLAADQFTSDSARLNGQANPRGSPATAWFEWGASLAYGNTTAPQPAGAGISLVSFSNLITSLSIGSTYYCRAVVSNAFGVVAGNNRSFTILDFFETAIPGLPEVYDGSVAWGDYDRDGRLDFLLTGFRSGGGISQLWRNTGSGFSNVTASVAPGLPGVYRSSVAWGDFDHDGRLDFLLTGNGGGIGEVAQLWRNNVPLSNAPPAASTDLSFAVSGSTVALNWTAPADDHTPTAGLNYNVRIGSTPGAADILSPMTLTNGFRLLPAIGNAQSGTSADYDFSRLTPGRDYYWSVQAVDTSFAGSPFAAEQRFALPPLLVSLIRYPNGTFEFHYTNQSAILTNFAVLVSTNLALAVTNWTSLGPALPLGGGLYRFTDLGAIGQPQRYYLLRQQ
jgi:hypothetical protein